MFKYDIAIIGGAGHVGLPLALTFAHKNKKVLILDINEQALETIKKGIMPHLEHEADEYLKEGLKKEKLFFSSKSEAISDAEIIIFTIGTPVDEFLNPDLKVVKECIDQFLPHMKNGQLIVLRSTIFPGTTDWVQQYLKSKNLKIEVAFCPERVVQSYSIQELQTMPQIVSGATQYAKERAVALFKNITSEIISIEPKEAEFTKLFTNAYRYIQFATANQFYMLAEKEGLDYYKIHKAATYNYPRMSDLPKPGFAAGPCLFKDTMQLAAFAKNEFSLGFDAMLVNEGLPLFVVEKLRQKYGDKLGQKTVGLLGMAFKPDTDDIRSSLSYKVKKVLSRYVKELLLCDPYVKTDKNLVSVEEVVSQSDILILCTPHKEYKNLNIKNKEIIDVWGIYHNHDIEVH